MLTFSSHRFRIIQYTNRYPREIFNGDNDVDTTLKTCFTSKEMGNGGRRVKDERRYESARERCR